MIKTNSLYDRLIWILTTLLFVLSTVLNMSYGGLILAALVAAIALVDILQNKMKLHIKFCILYLWIALFTFYVSINSLWAEVPQYATRHVSSLLEMMLVLVVLYSCYKDRYNAVEMLLRAVMWRGYFICLYVFSRYGVNSVIYMLRNDIRMDNDVLNANSIGMAIGYAIIINTYFILKYKKIRLLDVAMLPSFFLLIASASRKGLVLTGGGVLAVFLELNWNNKKKIQSFFRGVGVLVILLLGMLAISRLPFMSNMMNRMEDLILLLTGQGARGLSGYSRIEYMKLGIQLFKRNPLFGIGIDNARIYTLQLFGKDHYLHSNYFELLACGGLVGILIYYCIFTMIIRKNIKLKRWQNKESIFCLILLICMLVMDIGLVSYDNKITYYLLLILFLEIDQIKKTQVRL